MAKREEMTNRDNNNAERVAYFHNISTLTVDACENFYNEMSDEVKEKGWGLTINADNLTIGQKLNPLT